VVPHPGGLVTSVLRCNGRALSPGTTSALRDLMLNCSLNPRFFLSTSTKRTRPWLQWQQTDYAVTTLVGAGLTTAPADPFGGCAWSAEVVRSARARLQRVTSPFLLSPGRCCCGDIFAGAGRL